MIAKLIFVASCCVAVIQGSINYQYSAHQHLVPSVAAYRSYLQPQLSATSLVHSVYSGCASGCLPIANQYYQQYQQAPQIAHQFYQHAPQVYDPLHLGLSYTNLAPQYQYQFPLSYYPSLAIPPRIFHQMPQYVPGVTQAIPSNEIASSGYPNNFAPPTEIGSSNSPNSAVSDEDTIEVGGNSFGFNSQQQPSSYPSPASGQALGQPEELSGQTVHNDPGLGLIIEARSNDKQTTQLAGKKRNSKRN